MLCSLNTAASEVKCYAAEQGDSRRETWGVRTRRNRGHYPFWETERKRSQAGPEGDQRATGALLCLTDQGRLEEVGEVSAV